MNVIRRNVKLALGWEHNGIRFDNRNFPNHEKKAINWKHSACIFSSRKMFSSIARNVTKFVRTQIVPANNGILAAAQIHTSRTLCQGDDDKDRSKWARYNEKIYPPQKPGEEPRPAVSFLMQPICMSTQNVFT